MRFLHKKGSQETEKKISLFMAIPMHPSLSNYIERILENFNTITQERRAALSDIASYIITRQGNNKTAKLTFICTHNSRRSHLCQIWATTAAAYYELKDIQTFSGGTEATAFNPRAVSALQRAGFYIENPGGDNPHYKVSFSNESIPIECFSKVYNHNFNPQKEFAAIMTCSDADESCPLVIGADYRISIPFEDPKVADNTDAESDKYDERCFQIATEMFYIMKQVAKK